MKRMRVIKITAVLLIIVATTMLLGSIPPPAGAADPPMNAGEAIDAVLGRDGEMANLRLRENFAYNRLGNLASNPHYGIQNYDDPAGRSSNEGLSIAEYTSELHDIWAKMDMRSNSAVVEVLTVIITIDIQMIRQKELTELQDNLAEWIKTAEADFKTSKITQDVLNGLKDTSEQIKRNLTTTGLRLSAQQNRFRQLTGHYIPDDFDFTSAWLLVDAEKIPDDISYSPRPHTFFSGVPGLIPPPAESRTVTEALSEARISLIALHESLLGYQQTDEVLQTMQEQFKTGEIDKYTLYDATTGLVFSGLGVYDAKYGYALSLLELDKLTGGVISSQYSENQAEWFSEMESVFNGRYSVSYPWMRFRSGEWILSGAQDDEEKVTLNIIKTWEGPGEPDSIRLYYNDRLLAEGGLTGRFTFTPPRYERSRLIEVRYYDDDGILLYRVYLDGLVNAGRFFWLDDSFMDVNLMKLGTPVLRNNQSAGRIEWDDVAPRGFLEKYEITISNVTFNGMSVSLDGSRNGNSFDYAGYFKNEPSGDYRFTLTVKAISIDPKRCEDSDPADRTFTYSKPAPPPITTQSSLNP